jgi:hypothetical protein
VDLALGTLLDTALVLELTPVLVTVLATGEGYSEGFGIACC